MHENTLGLTVPAVLRSLAVVDLEREGCLALGLLRRHERIQPRLEHVHGIVQI